MIMWSDIIKSLLIVGTDQLKKKFVFFFSPNLLSQETLASFYYKNSVGGGQLQLS